MKATTAHLVTVANYAKIKGVSTAAVYQWIEAGRVTMIPIDGKKFIDTKKSKP